MSKSIDKFIKNILPVPQDPKAHKAQIEWLGRNSWFGEDVTLTLNAVMVIEKIKENDKLDNSSPGFWYAVDFHMIAMKENDFEFKPTFH
jgi:hypothetical protein